MKAASIVPQPYLDLIKHDNYHLALAHLIGKDGFEQYSRFYSDMGDDPEKFLIMDNGLIEGDPRPIDELLDKALAIGADELVLPDVFQNKDETLSDAHDAINYMQAVHAGIRAMVVPQGQNMIEWMDCAKEMLTWPIQTIGIPKVLTKMGGRDGRLFALDLLQEHLGDVEVHLLGCWDSPLELKIIENAIRAQKIKPVRGVDSAIAYVYARAGLKMCSAERPLGQIDFAAEDADLAALKFNINMWHEETAALPPLGEQSNVRKLFM